MPGSPNQLAPTQEVHTSPGNTPSNTHSSLISAERRQKLDRLLQWSADNDGFVHPDIEFVYHPDKGYHAIVALGREIKAQTRIASAPMTTTISVLNALDVEPFGNHGTKFPDPFLQTYQHKPEVLQTLFLMEQHVLEEKSWWSPYIATLPTVADVRNLGFETEQDKAWIRGTNVETALLLQDQKWQDQYLQAVETLTSLNWANATNGKYTWDLYKWAASIYGSRSFTSQVLTDTTPYDRARPMSSEDPDHLMLSRLFSERFAVLLPVLDLPNHKPAALVEWQARHWYVGLQMLSDYKERQELFNNYGPRDNEGLFLAYGFVLEDNPFDHITIQIQVPPGSPLEHARTWPRDERSNEDHRGFIFDSRNPIFKEAPCLERAPFSYDLLDSVSVLLANDRELQAMYAQGKTLMSSSLGGTFRDFRNLLATISQMMQDCKARRRRVQDNEPTRTNPRLQPTSQKQKYAQIYRNNQSKILREAIAACALVLLHASTDLSIHDLILSAQLKLPQHFRTGDDETFKRVRFLTSKHELFTAGGLISMLPSSMSRTLQKCITDMELELRRSNPGIEYADIVKSTLALSFAAMCHQLRSGTELPRRFRSWIEELTSLYPPEDESWSFVPHDGPYSPGEEPPPALMALLKATTKVANRLPSSASTKQWFQPNMLCWGWNVMEEEGVRVPGEIEAFLSSEPEKVTELMGFLIYCKQY